MLFLGRRVLGTRVLHLNEDLEKFASHVDGHDSTRIHCVVAPPRSPRTVEKNISLTYSRIHLLLWKPCHVSIFFLLWYVQSVLGRVK